MSLEGNVEGTNEIKGRIYTIPQADPTLTKEGYAADAKATGEKIKNCFPLTGGTIANDGANPIILKSNTENFVSLPMVGKDGTLGFFAMNGANLPVFVENDGSTVRTLLHTGNKPTGTYTGNGDATSRTVNLGGIGTVVYISGGGYGVFVTQMGGIVFAYDGRAISMLSNSEIKFAEGVLTIATTNSAVNASGTNHSYQVL